MADRNTKVNRDTMNKKRIRKVRVHKPDPTTEEIDTFGEDINSKLVTPNVNIDRSDDIQSIHIDNFK
ncbi:hypothetical protein [Turkeypox virus]|uniref:Uncharacterized protein n=1 Tax=Turkeypox virus TaxID=336486 RepID=A0A0M3ZK22_9POXV|nr:hypothetical protein ASN15_gp083 [Turkeypox virus]ALA62457.1 hypothetical protein [Turkeypox virus]